MNEIIEEWKPICGYEGLYEVSNLGQVKSLNYKYTKQEKILKQGKMKNGYLKVNLWKNEKVKQYYVHRLVANAFIENPSILPCVNHKDENPSNNIVNNLEWCDAKYNTNYGTAQQRKVANTDYKARTANTDYKARTAKMDYKAKVANTDYKAIAEKQSKQVYQYNKNYELVGIWQSTMECERNGFDQSAVSNCCRGERKTHKGYIWSYEEIKKGE